MVISKISKNQGMDNYKELVKQLQQETRILFYDKMMYEINDSLTSILASCDADGKEAIPKIKQYIHRINQSLSSAKNFNAGVIGSKNFNIGIVLQNIIYVIKEKYKDAKIACLISDIKAPVYGDQSKFEELLLYILVNIFSYHEAFNSEMLIELRQKDQDAIITILKDSHIFGQEDLQHINSVNEEAGFEGKVQITPHGKGVEVIISIPLQFGAFSVNQAGKNTHTVNKIQLQIKQVRPENKPVIEKEHDISAQSAVSL